MMTPGLTWFSSLTIERAPWLDGGWHVEWADGRVTKITLSVIWVDGESMVVKKIRWAA